MNLHPLRRLLRLVLWLTVSFFVLFGVVALALRTTLVQTTLVQWMAGRVSERLGFECTIGGFYLDWVDFASIRQLEIKDRQGHSMVKVDRVRVNVKVASLLERNINLDLVEIRNGSVQVRKNKENGRMNFNEFVEAVDFWVNGDDTTRSANPPVFSIDQALLSRVDFVYWDEREAPLPMQFDYYHFRLKGVSGMVKNFRQRRDTIELDARNLRAIDQATRLPVHSLSTRFRYTRNHMVFRNLRAEIGDSFLGDSLSFSYGSTADFSDFNQKIRIQARLDSSVVSGQDLSFFAPSLKDCYETYTVSGRVDGTVDNIRWRNMQLRTGRSSYFTGTLKMKGLPELDETYVDLRLRPSYLDPADLTYYAGKEAARAVGMLGPMTVSGSFTGFFRNFVTRSTFRTRLGDVDADMQMTLASEPEASTYKGRLRTHDFDLGRLLNQTRYVQKIDLDGSFHGTGFKPENADVFVDARIGRFGVWGYDYRNIETEGHFRRQQFDGNLHIRDPHLVFKGSGSVDLRKGREVVDLEAFLGRANFKPLNLTADPLDCSAEVGMKFRGFDFDNFLGSIRLRNLRVLLRDERLDVNELNIDSHIENGVKTFHFDSPLLDARLEGSFKYREFAEDAIALVDEYRRLIRNQAQINNLEQIRLRRAQARNYAIDGRFLVKDLNPLLDLLDAEVSISPNTGVDARFEFGQTETVTLNTLIDSLRIGEKRIYRTTFNLLATKTMERPDVVAELYAYSEKQDWSPDVKTEKILLDAVWDRGKIGFKLRAREQASTNRANIFGEVLFEPFNTRIRLQNSTLSLVERLWEIDDASEIEISDTATVLLRNISLRNENQEVAVEGFLTGAPEDTLFVRARNLNLLTLKPLVKDDIFGTANAGISITHLSSSPLVEGYMRIDSLAYSGFHFGDFDGTARWNMVQKNLELQGHLERERAEVLRLSGFFTPGIPEPLDLRARVTRLNLNLIQMFVGRYVSGVRGWASGEVNIRGTIREPKLTGSLFVREGQVKINYLNTTYFFSHPVVFSPGEISASGAVLTDERGETGVLTRAALLHRNYEDFKVDLQGTLTNFMVFNIPSSAGELYYGSTICTGDLRITGKLDDVTIRANARTNKGTRIFIPLDGTVREDMGESYITFTNGRDEAAVRQDSIGKVKLSGIKMDFDLEVTEDAYGEIIFDKKAGDIIRASGTGKIKMIVDTRGEFSVIGQYVIRKGDYHFTTYNLVNKDFDIKPGSTITWNGPVLEGQMDILAEYNLNASLGPLASSDQEIQQRPEARRRYPVMVSMRLTDQLLKPNISLGLDIRDYPRNSDLNFYVQAFLARIATDEQELNRQVFSLMIFRMFAPMGEFTRTSGISYSSFSDLVSNQLSSWLSQFDENLEVSVDLSGLSQTDLNNFQLRFSYTMLDGRLRLTRDGGFTNAANQTSALSIAGDWTLEYMLSKNGMFRVKMFHRINPNLVLSGLSSNNTTQGASLLHTQSFNKLRELFPARRRKSKARTPAPTEPPPASGVPAARVQSRPQEVPPQTRP